MGKLLNQNDVHALIKNNGQVLYWNNGQALK